MGDDHEREIECTPQLIQQVDRHPQRHVERRNRLIGEDHARARRQGTRDRHSLALTPESWCGYRSGILRVEADFTKTSATRCG